MTDRPRPIEDSFPPSPSILPVSPPLDLAIRRTGVSASEIAAVLGLSRYEDALTIWARKTDEMEKPKRIDVGPMRWGTSQEPEILRAYSEITATVLIRPGTLSHPKREWQMATPDALVIEGDKVAPLHAVRGVEAKTAGWRMRGEWGDPENPDERDKIPLEYFLQCQQGMSVTELEEWDVPALIGGSDFSIYHLTADHELQAMMIEGAQEFVERYLRPRVMPPPGWTQASSEFIKKKFPSHESGLVTAERKHLPIVQRLYALGKIQELLDKELEWTKNELKFSIGSGEGLKGDGWKISWKKNKDSRRMDWEDAAYEYKGVLELVGSIDGIPDDAREAIRESLRKSFEYTQQGARPFRATLPDDLFLKQIQGLTSSIALIEGFRKGDKP